MDHPAGDHVVGNAAWLAGAWFAFAAIVATVRFVAGPTPEADLPEADLSAVDEPRGARPSNGRNRT
jgi:hypothetical protein